MSKKTKFVTGILSILILSLCSCNGKQVAATPTEIINIPTDTLPTAMQTPSSSSLFLDTESIGTPVPKAHIARYRYVKINLAILLDETKQTSRLKENSEITLNLFPDLAYTGVIDHFEQNGTDFTWSGHLKDIEYSELTMLITGETFIAHFASPAGVYEVSNVEDDVYQIVMIDQTKLPGGDG